MEAFAHELARLEAAGALHLDDAQRAAIAANQQAQLAEWRERFDIDVGQRQRQLSWGVKLAAFCAALALGMGVFLLLWRLWRQMDEAGQVLLPLLAAVAFTVACGVCAAREKGGHFARLFGALASVCFWLDVALLARMFNMPAAPGFFLLLGCFALALVLACGARLLLAAGLGALAVFVAAHCLQFAGWWWSAFSQRPEAFLPAAWLLAALAWALQRRGSELAGTARVMALLVWFVPALWVGFSGEQSFLPFAAGAVEALWQALAGASTVALAALGVRRGWAETVRLSVFFGALLPIIKFFEWWWDALPKELFFLLIGLIAVLAVLLLRRLRASTQAASAPAAQKAPAPWRGLPQLAQRGWGAEAQRAALGTALALAALVAGNAAALWQARANRAHVQAGLQLSAREVLAYDSRSISGRNVGARLRVRERCEPAGSALCYGRAVPWLTADKLRALGFDTDAAAQGRAAPERPAWLVLELAGDAWQQEAARLEQLVQQAQHDVERAADNSARERARERLLRRQQSLREEQQEASRLFIVDAGRSAQELRQRWPQEQRHVIVPGKVRMRGRQASVELLVDELFVPRRFAGAAAKAAEARQARITASVREEQAAARELPAATGPLLRFGARGLPWIAAWDAEQN